MALQSEVSPPMVGDANKDTKIDGDTKSEDSDSSPSTDEEVDLEEGEILDSGGEEEMKASPLKESLDKKCLENIELLVKSAKKVINESSEINNTTQQHMKKKNAKYMDHDMMENSNEEEENDQAGWCPTAKFKSKFSDGPIDYRRELDAYRGGSPPSSPDRKSHREKRKKRTKSKTKKKKIYKSKDSKKNIRRVPSGKICKFFKEGKCTKGSDCPFSHYRPVKKELCRFYLNGHCNKGKECIYMHNDFPCKFYHTGSECYSMDKCRFSHAPLTEETRKLLADYLKNHRSNEDYDRKRRKSSSPEPPTKRPCLLGSPPRHIREAEETKRWQEEMKTLQQQNQPGFEIHLSPVRDPASPPPPQFVKPNFYQDTIKTPSPQKRRGIVEEGPRNLSVFAENEISNQPTAPCNEDVSWQNIVNLVQKLAAPTEEPTPNYIEQTDFASDVKFDETTQFSEMDSSMDCPLAPSPEVKEEDTDEPIEIPSHLPRKQRELFLRIQQQNRKTMPAAPTPVEENKERWYSSEDDDEDADQPLANVLKKLNKTPPSIKENKGSLDLMQMLSKIQQKAVKPESPPEAQTHQGTFWKNLLTGSIPAKPVEAGKRRTLLPDPVKTEETKLPKDPRLKNRDPRTLANTINEKPSPPVCNPEATLPFNNAETVPYKLCGILTEPRNYLPYIHASQSDPKLLNDPRIRRHLKPTLETVENGKDVPPIPPLLLSKLDTKLDINIFESNSSTKSDPRQRDSPAEESSVEKPMPASHLPRAIADPRMAKLHHPLDPRRLTAPRKSNMDYASPLSSCEDSKSVGYNQRRPPQRTPQTLDQECDVNLKDMFKTIDPTASPFC